MVSALSQALIVSKDYWGDSHYGPKQITALHLTAYFGVDEAANTLLKHGRRPDLKDNYGQTPLSSAAENGHDGVFKLLLETGKVNADSKDTLFGRTPLSWAAEKGHDGVVELLLMTDKVDADSKDAASGRTPLSWAARNGHDGIVKLLLDTGEVDADSKDMRFGRTPLSWAAEKGHDGVVKLLRNYQQRKL